MPRHAAILKVAGKVQRTRNVLQMKPDTAGAGQSGSGVWEATEMSAEMWSRSACDGNVTACIVMHRFCVLTLMMRGSEEAGSAQGDDLRPRNAKRNCYSPHLHNLFGKPRLRLLRHAALAP